MNEVSQFVKRPLVAVVVLLAIFVSVASLLVFVVDFLKTLSFPAPTLENAAKVLAATVVGYIFTSETVPALTRVVAATLASRQQDGPVQR
jgi:putative flippase GtrA